jgi:hypothetical protein
MNDEIVIADFNFGTLGWVGVFILGICTLVAVKIVLDIVRVEYRVWKVRRKK